MSDQIVKMMPATASAERIYLRNMLASPRPILFRRLTRGKHHRGLDPEHGPDAYQGGDEANDDNSHSAHERVGPHHTHRVARADGELDGQRACPKTHAGAD